jgi:hypothetical protein
MQAAVKPAAMICFTVGSPDQTTLTLAECAVPDPFSGLIPLWFLRQNLIGLTFHLWTNVSPMESIEKLGSIKINFEIGTNPQLPIVHCLRIRARPCPAKTRVA